LWRFLPCLQESSCAPRCLDDLERLIWSDVASTATIRRFLRYDSLYSGRCVGGDGAARRSGASHVAFVRLAVPENAHSNTVSMAVCRRLLDDGTPETRFIRTPNQTSVKSVALALSENTPYLKHLFYLPMRCWLASEAPI